MKKSSILWVVLPMMAAALMTTACASDDSTDETTAEQSAAKTIPYTVAVGQDETADTRATVADDMKTLKFAAGDKLYITGANIQGVLDIQTGAGTANATFSGNLTYSGSGNPADNLKLTATLVSAQQTGGQVSVDAAGAVRVNYPTTAYCTSVNKAVQEYSRLTGTSTYGKKTFDLSQQTAFINFVVAPGGNVTNGESVSAVVKNGATTLCQANVTTTTENEKVVARFVLPVAKGTALSSATVNVNERGEMSIKNATLAGKVYNVYKSVSPLAYVTNDDLGKVIGADGNIYANAQAATEANTTAVAMIACVGSGTGFAHGLAIQLNVDATNNEIRWADAYDYSGYPEISSDGVGTWRLPSTEDWLNILKACAVTGDQFSDKLTDIMTVKGFIDKVKAAGTSYTQNGYWTSTLDLGSNEMVFIIGFDFDNNQAHFGSTSSGGGRPFIGCFAF